MKSKFKPFARFNEMFVKIIETKKYETTLEKEAIAWWKENFNGKFGVKSEHNNDFGWAYSFGLLSFSAKGLGEGWGGSYHYKFLLKMAHFEFWKVKEWCEGFEYGKHCITSKSKKGKYRDANPYKDSGNFYADAAWDAGYVMGLHNFSFFKRGV